MGRMSNEEKELRKILSANILHRLAETNISMLTVKNTNVFLMLRNALANKFTVLELDRIQTELANLDE